MREIGPWGVTYKTKDFVRILTDCRHGWQRDEEGQITGYDKRIKYYEGEIISLKEGEWRELGTMQIRPVGGKEYASYTPAKRRIFACGVRRRFGYWGSSFRRKVGGFLYACVEIPCALVARIVEGLFRFLGLSKMIDFSAVIVFLALLGTLLWLVIG